jgi:hypothetical protein
MLKPDPSALSPVCVEIVNVTFGAGTLPGIRRDVRRNLKQISFTVPELFTESGGMFAGI